ncbi:mannosyl-3-phosphoglycerate synthase, partial [Lasiosphaeris hirsuta]
MRVSRPRKSLTVGNLSIMHEIKVMELDGGEATGAHAAPAPGPWRPFASIPAWPSFWSRTADASTAEKEREPEWETGDLGAISISHAVLDKILAQMVIIVPCMDESPEIIEGVLSGIPHSCLIIIVSNSSRRPDSADGYRAEVEMLRNFCGSRRQALAVHQKDPGVAAAIQAAGMPELVAADGTIRKGKGEGMILGLILAAALCPERKYVGFVDADNQVPGAVHEYCRTYASGFALYPSSEDQHIMVRLRWASKPKARGDTIVFEPEGRSSHIVNNWLNQVLSPITMAADATAAPSDSDRVVVTGNAGEHAMTMCLALKLMLAGGYAIEPFHFIDLLSRQLPSLLLSSAVPSSASSASPVRILQIRTRNPHIHRPSDDSHISAMWKVGLGTIYYH